MLEFEADSQRVQAILERRPAAELAAFILSLARVESTGLYVQAFAFADDPEAAAALLWREIQILRQGQGTYSFQERLAMDWGDRATRALDAIETIVLPRDRTAAADLLTEFIVVSERIIVNCYEDEASVKLIERAWRMFEAL